MNKLAATVCAFLLTTSLALAQVPPCDGGTKGLTAVDTLRTTVCIPPTNSPVYGDSTNVGVSPASGPTYRTKGKSNGQITLEICIWRSQNGNVYSVDPASIAIGGDAGTIDSMPTRAIFDLIASSAAAKVVAAGYSTCSAADQVNTNNVRISMPSCVRRSGSGTGTGFESCDGTTCCTRIYSVTCSEGSYTPKVQWVGSEGGGGCAAGDGCESLCD